MTGKLRHHPLLASFAEWLEPKGSDGTPRAGKSTSTGWPEERYHRSIKLPRRSRAPAGRSVGEGRPRAPQVAIASACPDRAAFACAHLRRAT